MKLWEQRYFLCNTDGNTEKMAAEGSASSCGFCLSHKELRTAETPASGQTMSTCVSCTWPLFSLPAGTQRKTGTQTTFYLSFTCFLVIFPCCCDKKQSQKGGVYLGSQFEGIQSTMVVSGKFARLVVPIAQKQREE